jgi:hypothetical protein
MKAITEKHWRTAPNGWGQDSTSAEQLFEIESADVNTVRHNWRGQGHSSYTFHASDAGRNIAVYTDKGNWTCWIFSSREVPNG